jgi:hypothetical protein
LRRAIASCCGFRRPTITAWPCSRSMRAGAGQTPAHRARSVSAPLASSASRLRKRRCGMVRSSSISPRGVSSLAMRSPFVSSRRTTPRGHRPPRAASSC